MSKHGPFSSKSVHKDGSKEYKDNMEHMAEEVAACLRTASFGDYGTCSNYYPYACVYGLLVGQLMYYKLDIVCVLLQ